MMILNALVEGLKRRSKDDFKGRHFEATLILQAVSWYLRYPLIARSTTHRTARVPDTRGRAAEPAFTRGTGRVACNPVSH